MQSAKDILMGLLVFTLLCGVIIDLIFRSIIHGKNEFKAIDIEKPVYPDSEFNSNDWESYNQSNKSTI